MGRSGKKRRQRSKEERQKFEERAQYLKIEKCIESWSKKQPLARFAYDYLCDLVHPNKGSNLVLLVKREQSVLFDVDGSVEIGHLIFDRIFPLVIKLCMDETGHLFIAFAFLGADEERHACLPDTRWPGDPRDQKRERRSYKQNITH